ncbi:MAG: alpha/beta hydrolase fold domain-containing protein [Fimbriiglobus sp.]
MPRAAAFVAVLLALVTKTAAAETPDRFFDVTYSTADGGPLKLDLVVPAGPGPFPVVVCFHGGAWKYGSRKDLSRSVINGLDFIGGEQRSLLELLAKKGFAAASVSYRLAPAAKFPAQIIDAKTAVRFLRANAKQYRLDPTRVAACGFSAGGHLACLMATTPGHSDFSGPEFPKESDRITCAVNYFGPTDLSLYADTPGVEKASMVPLLGATWKDRPEVFQNASPLEYAGKTTCPILTIHGTADVIVPVIHAERFHAKLTAAGADSTLVTVRGKGHGWGGTAATATTDTTCRFLIKNLGAK